MPRVGRRAVQRAVRKALRRRLRADAVAAAVMVLVMVAATACGGSSSGGKTATDGSPSNTAITGTINVSAASSLTEAFTTLGKQFESAHPGVKVVFNFGPSSLLANQINQGAPVDVFASASTANMDQVVSAGGADDPTPFATNEMEIATPPSNPGNVRSVSDLAGSGVKVAVCQAEVPCGATAAKVFDSAHVSVVPVTAEIDV